MEVIQTGKSHFASALCRQSLDCGRGKKRSDLGLSGHAISENKADRSDDLSINNFSAHSQQLHATQCNEASFPQ